MTSKVSELACFLGDNEGRKKHGAVICVAPSKCGELFATGVNKTLKVTICMLNHKFPICAVLAISLIMIATIYVGRYTISRKHWHVVHRVLSPSQTPYIRSDGWIT